MRPDLDIRENVLRELAWEPGVKEHQIGVQARDGVVILGGIVPDDDIARAACAAAHRAPGVKDVVSELGVEHPRAEGPDDLTLARAVRRALSETPATEAANVRTMVSGGVVILSGAVHSADARAAAGEVVGRVAGVKRVVDDLRVDPRAARAAVEQAVCAVVGAHPWSQNSAFKISVADGRVQISGPVTSPEERRALLDAVRAVPGVETIEELLAVAEA